MTGVQIADDTEELAGPFLLEGTDLELAHNLQGEDLVLRVNKGGVLVFRAMLRDAVPQMLGSRLVHFNSFAPDLVFTISDREEGLMRMLRAAGIMEHRPTRGGLCWPGCGGRHEGQQADAHRLCGEGAARRRAETHLDPDRGSMAT